jgi:hypothetical protein
MVPPPAPAAALARAAAQAAQPAALAARPIAGPQWLVAIEEVALIAAKAEVAAARQRPATETQLLQRALSVVLGD